MAMEVADAAVSGIVHINEQTVAHEANAPFGGVAASGTGSRFGGAEANIEAFTETQWLTVRSKIAPYRSEPGVSPPSRARRAAAPVPGWGRLVSQCAPPRRSRDVQWVFESIVLGPPIGCCKHA